MNKWVYVKLYFLYHLMHIFSSLQLKHIALFRPYLVPFMTRWIARQQASSSEIQAYIYICILQKKLPGSKVNKDHSHHKLTFGTHTQVSPLLTPLWLRTITASNKSMSSYNNENTSSCFGQKQLAYRTFKKSDNTIQTCVTIGWIQKDSRVKSSLWI